MAELGAKGSLRVMIAGGATGGHLYPGIAMVEELKSRAGAKVFLFVGADGGLEEKVLPREGYSLKTIKVGKLAGKRVGGRLLALLQLPIAFIQSLWIILNFRPDVVVGLGGYAAGPVVLMAAFLGIPTIIHEQNVLPGFTNRALARFVDAIAVSFPQTVVAFPANKTTVTGNPLRRSFFSPLHEPRKTHPDGATILILGGSRGARRINDATLEALPLLTALKEPLRIIHQTGEEDYERVRAAYSACSIKAEVSPYFYDIPRHYRDADLILARAGATTLAELMACGKASILIPYPYAASGHQDINARILEEAGAAVVLKDGALNGRILAETVKELVQDRERLRCMGGRAASFGKPDAAERVADLVYVIALNDFSAAEEGQLHSFRSNT